jgi:LPS export ABC transporter protein LptC
MAVILTLTVAGIYLRRILREKAAQRNAPAPVAPMVQQQSAGFSFSHVEGDRTIFTLHASQATEFKEKNRSELDDVVITVFGREEMRHDTIHARQCSYEPGTGGISCGGVVEMDFESAKDALHSPGQRVVHMTARNMSFDKKSGVLSTREQVEIRFPQGEGQGRGLVYDSQKGSASLEGDVRLKLQTRPGAVSILLSGSRMEFLHSENSLRLAGAARAQQGDTELDAAVLTAALDAEQHVRQVSAEGNPIVQVTKPGDFSDLHAGHMLAEVNSDGVVEQITASGGVSGSRKNAKSEDRFRADQAVIKMLTVGPMRNQPGTLLATGRVGVVSREGPQTRQIDTAALKLTFAENPAGRGSHVAAAETQAPASITLQAPGENSQIHARQLTTSFDAQGRLQKLLGHNGVTLNRTSGNGPPQQITADETVIFYAGGDWTEVDDMGNVRFHQGDRSATAAHAHITRATNDIQLDGSPVVADANSRVAAPSIQMNQESGDMRADGGVSTTYSSGGQGGGPNLDNGPAHITAQSLRGNSKTGVAHYLGNARLWQGEAVVQSDEMKLDRAMRSLIASGRVRSLMAQAPKGKGETSAGVWQVTSAKLTYIDSAGTALYEGGVHANNVQGTMISRSLELFLTADAAGRRSVDRAVALGGVEIQQGVRVGKAQKGEYFSSEGKYVLSGGDPMILDGTNGVTRGHSLTFFTANDTILVDSQAGSRTLTKHQVEK